MKFIIRFLALPFLVACRSKTDRKETPAADTTNKGYLYMDENYFRLKTVILFVNKEALSQSLKDKLGIN